VGTNWQIRVLNDPYLAAVLRGWSRNVENKSKMADGRIFVNAATRSFILLASIFTPPPPPVDVRSTAIRGSVGLFLYICPPSYLKYEMFKRQQIFAVAAARSFSDDKRYILSVLWMTSCFHTV